MRELHVNRSEIARVTGINIAHISRVFSGKSKPSLTLARQIATHLDISVEELCAFLGLGEVKLKKYERKEAKRGNHGNSGSDSRGAGDAQGRGPESGQGVRPLRGLEVSGEPDKSTPLAG